MTKGQAKFLSDSKLLFFAIIDGFNSMQEGAEEIQAEDMDLGKSGEGELLSERLIFNGIVRNSLKPEVQELWDWFISGEGGPDWIPKEPHNDQT